MAIGLYRAFYANKIVRFSNVMPMLLLFFVNICIILLMFKELLIYSVILYVSSFVICVVDNKNMLHRGSPPHQHIRISLNLFRKHTGNCIMFLQKKVNKLKIKSYAGDLLRQGGKDVPPNGSDFSLRRGAAA